MWRAAPSTREQALRLAPWALAGLTVVLWLTAYRHGPWAGTDTADSPYFQDVADRISDGRLPFVHYDLEYPPLGAVVLWLAGALPGSYAWGLSLVEMAAAVATVLGAHALARALGLSAGRSLGATAIVAVSPLLVGNIMRGRFDFVVVAVVAWVLWAAVRGRFRTAWLLLAAAVLVKLMPVVLVPALAVLHARRHGRAGAVRGVAWFAGSLAVVVVPLAALSPSGTWSFVRYNLNRPLQMESLGSSLMMVAHKVGGLDVRFVDNFKSRNVDGAVAEQVAAACSALLAVAVVVIAVRLWMVIRDRPADAAGGPFVAASAATTGALLAFNKVFTPQFIVLLLPACLLVAGRAGRVTAGLAVGALLLTQAYYPRAWVQVSELDTGPVAVLLVRNLVVLAIVVAAWPRRERVRAKPRSAPASSAQAGSAASSPPGRGTWRPRMRSLPAVSGSRRSASAAGARQPPRTSIISDVPMTPARPPSAARPTEPATTWQARTNAVVVARTSVGKSSAM